MDIITQGVVGAVAAQVIAPKKETRKWALVGGIAGLVPDLDVLIRSASDPLLFLEYHRHFTHSLFFVPVGAVVVAWTLAFLFRRTFNFKKILFPAIIGCATHGLLDACTSYGTSLYWPVSSRKVAWNIVSIVDPLFTLPLIIGLALTSFKGQERWVRYCAVLILCYLSFGIYQNQAARHLQERLAQSRGHLIERGRVKPSFGNNILFRSYYQYNQYYYVDAIRLPWWGEPKIYEGSRVRLLELPQFLKTYELSETQARDIVRFANFSAGYLIEHPHHPQVVGDLRYALLPNSIAPLWGVEWSLVPTSAHTPFLNFRDVSESMRKQYWKMIVGEELY